MSEEGKVIEFYDGICRDIADDNIETLIEGFAGFKNPAWGNVCKWVNVSGIAEVSKTIETINNTDYDAIETVTVSMSDAA